MWHGTGCKLDLLNFTGIKSLDVCFNIITSEASELTNWP